MRVLKPKHKLIHWPIRGEEIISKNRYEFKVKPSKTKQNCKGRGNTRGYESQLGLALHLISSEGSESLNFLDQSQSVVKQISDYFRYSIENCAKWDERPSLPPIYTLSVLLLYHPCYHCKGAWLERIFLSSMKSFCQKKLVIFNLKVVVPKSRRRSFNISKYSECCAPIDRCT